MTCIFSRTIFFYKENSSCGTGASQIITTAVYLSLSLYSFVLCLISHYSCSSGIPLPSVIVSFINSIAHNMWFGIRLINIGARGREVAISYILQQNIRPETLPTFPPIPYNIPPADKCMRSGVSPQLIPVAAQEKAVAMPRTVLSDSGMRVTTALSGLKVLTV